MRSMLLVLIPIGILLGVLGLSLFPRSEEVLIVASTTSLYDTGLLDVLGQELSPKLGLSIKFIPTGTGLALRNARNGDVDAILVHAPSAEASFLEGGWGVNRKLVAYNYFTIVGPESDPAGIANLSPTEALRKIRNAGLQGKGAWVSRGDGSGTNIKEELLWEEAGLDPEEVKKDAWYVESGSGMANTLRLANEREAYTLSDTATYLGFRERGIISLGILMESGKELLNVYSVIAVHPNRHPDVNFEGAMKLVRWLVSNEGQGLFARYGGTDHGTRLFFPIAEKMVVSEPDEVASWVRDYAFINGSECPPEHRFQEGNLYSGDE